MYTSDMVKKINTNNEQYRKILPELVALFGVSARKNVWLCWVNACELLVSLRKEKNI